VKAHSGILLNECADILATKGVMNEPSHGLVQYVVPVGEDTDNHEYLLKDGEETPMDDWRGEEKPDRTYVMKDGDNLFGCLVSAPPSDDSDSDVVPDAVSDSEPEESDTQPQPPSHPEDENVIDSRVTYIGSVHSQQAARRQEPEWWTEASDHSWGVALPPIDVIQPACPKEFREEVSSDIFAFDQQGCQTQRDSSGPMVGPSEENELIGGIVGVLWNDHYATMTRYCGQGKTAEELTL
jgi:hypothetical protein